MGKSTRYAIVTNHKPSVRKPASDDQSKQFLEPDNHGQIATKSETDTRTQAEKFEDAAREAGCDPGDDAFKGVLRKLAKPKS